MADDVDALKAYVASLDYDTEDDWADEVWALAVERVEDRLAAHGLTEDDISATKLKQAHLEVGAIEYYKKAAVNGTVPFDSSKVTTGPLADPDEVIDAIIGDDAPAGFA